MIQRVIFAAVVSAALVGGAALWVWPREAECAGCRTGKCTSAAQCGGPTSGCVCIKSGGSGIYGYCAAVN